MRIGVDVRCLMEGKRTGVEEYTLGLLQAMVHSAPEHTFVLFANSRRASALPAFAGPNIEVCWYRFPNTLFNLSLKFLALPSLDRLVGGVDVFFVPSFRLTPLTRGCPLVLTVHDLTYVRHPEWYSRDRRLWHTLMSPRLLVQRAAAVIAVSQATANDLNSLYRVPRKRISVIPSGLGIAEQALNTTPPQAESVRRRLGLPPRYLLFLGTLEPRKNLDVLLSAYTRVRDAGFPHALVLAGIHGWLPPEFYHTLRRQPYAADIAPIGFVADADKPALYALADLFVYPSVYEGFGFPPLEALACGTPVVTSFNSAIPEVVGRWATLTNPYDPEELAAVILERLREGGRVPRLVSDEVRRRYSWVTAARATLAVLQRAASVAGQPEQTKKLATS